MAQLLRPTNFDAINILETTELSADAAAEQKVAQLLNPQGFEPNDFFVIGNLAAENAQLAKIDSLDDSQVTAFENYVNLHRRGEAITKLFADKIRIYRAANVDGSVPADGAFSHVGTIDIEVDQSYSEFTDGSGGPDYWYKKTYYNSLSSSETELSDATAVRGGGYGGYATWEEVREEAGLTNNRWIGEQIYVEKLLAAQSEVNASLRIGGYTLPLTTTPSIVKNATILIAAGYVLLKEYGPENSGTNKEGNLKLTEGRKLLMKIEGGSQLVDDSGNHVSGANRIAGFPDNDTYPTAPQFKITDKF